MNRLGGDAMRVVGYVRLSRDEDKESYSSILSQKSIIAEYALQHNWTIAKYYEDDNWSGYSFDRPAFNELMKELERGNIDIVIAKDLSRIGRHNAYTLLFLDKIKLLNKRLILPKEGSGYDTSEDESDLLGITTWYNEMYVKDISRKIKGSIRAKQKEGRMIIKEAFGYKRSQADKHKLEVDPEAAEIVRKIYKHYLSGIGYRKIAELLNLEGYPTPSQYHIFKTGGASIKGKAAVKWNSVHVQRILKNDIYTGTLRLGKTEKKSIKGKSHKQPQENQYIFEDNHQAIISKEMFEEVRLMVQGRKCNHSKGAASLHNIFSGLIYCQDCGSYMIAYKRRGKPKSYICGSYHMHGNKICSRHTIQEDFLMEVVKTYIRFLAAAYTEETSRIQLDTATDFDQDNELLLKKLIKEQHQTKEHLKMLIFQKIRETKEDNDVQYQNIMNDSYSELENDLRRRLLYLEKRIKHTEQELRNRNAKTHDDPVQVLSQLLNNWQPIKKYMEILIDKILIDRDGNPTIYLKANILAICFHNREDVN
jgi:DNA invertase Pin-like site-specific DNA recombinase